MSDAIKAAQEAIGRSAKIVEEMVAMIDRAPSVPDTKLLAYLQQENDVLHEKVRKLELANDNLFRAIGKLTEAEEKLLRAAKEAEREACAKVADERAEICRQAMNGPPESLPEVEVHCLNEALHIAQLIRSRR